MDIFKEFLNWLLQLIKKPTPPAPPPVDPVPPTGTELDKLLALHNNHRKSKGLQPLKLELKVQTVAQNHTVWMQKNGTLSHSENGIGPGERLRSAGYGAMAVGENIAFGYTNAQSVFQGWLNSSGHRANIENGSYKVVGFGLQGKYWTALFASPTSFAFSDIDYLPDGLIKED